MQRDDDKLSMPGGFKSGKIGSPYDNIDDGGIQQNATSSVVSQEEPNAAAMRATNVTNPHGGKYAIAGPTMGGAPTPYDSNKTGQTKERLIGSLNENENQHDYSKNNTLHVDNTGSRHVRRSSLSEAVKTGATGAAAAGASVIAAAKKLIQGSEDDDADYRHGDDASHILKPTADTAGLEFSHLHTRKPPGPGDRPPVKLDIHPKKPSNLALYGNYASPGAHKQPGSLSDRTLAATPPPPISTPHKTIADPFGPVKISNWNDGKRHSDTANPTSEEFDAVSSHPTKDSSEKTLAAPGPGTHDTVIIHTVSEFPLKEGSTMLAEDTTRHTHPTVPTSGHSPLREEILYNNQSNNMGTGAKIGTGAAGLGAAGAAAAALRHDTGMHDQSAVPVYHIPTSQLPGSGTTHMPEEKRIPIAATSADSHRTTGIANTPMTDSSTNANINRGANIADNKSNAGDMHSDNAPKAAAATTGAALGAAAIPAAMHSQSDSATSTKQPVTESTPTLKKGESILDKIMGVFHHGPTINKDNTHRVATTEASTLLAQQEYASKNVGLRSSGHHPTATNVGSPTAHSSTSAPWIAASAGAIPLSKNIRGDERRDRNLSGNEGAAHDGKVPIRHNTSTIATTGIPPEVILNKTEYVPAERVHHYKQHHQHFLPQDQDLDGTDTRKTGMPGVPVDAAALAGAGAAAYMGTKTGMGHHEKNDRPVDRTTQLGVHEHTAYLPSAINTQQISPGVEPSSTATSTKGTTVSPTIQTDTLHAQNTDATKAHASHPITDTITAGLAAAGAATVATGAIAAGAVANWRHKSHDATTEKDMSQPGVATTTAAVAPGTSNVVEDKRRTSTFGPDHERGLGERILGYVGGYGPAEPQDLPLTDPKTLIPLNLDIHEAVSEEAQNRKRANEHRHTSLMQRIMSAIMSHHSASEYGPADLKDLSLTNPKTLEVMSATSLPSTAPTAETTKTAAPTAGMPKTAAVTDTGVKDKEMAPFGVPTSSGQTNVPTSKAATTESHPPDLETATAAKVAAAVAGTAAAIGMNKQPTSSTRATNPMATTATQPMATTTTTTMVPPVSTTGAQPMTTATTYPTTKTTAQPAPAAATQPLAAATTYPTTKTMAQPVQTTAAQPMTAATTYPTAETTTQPVDTMTESYSSGLEPAVATAAAATAAGAAAAIGMNKLSIPSTRATNPMATTTTQPMTTTTTMAPPVSTTAAQPLTAATTYPTTETATQPAPAATARPVDTMTGSYPSALKTAAAATGAGAAATGTTAAMGKNRHSMPSTATTYPTTTTAAQPVSTTATQPVASTGTHPLNTTGTHPSGLKSAVATTGTTVAAAGAAAAAATVATGAIAAGAVANLRRKSHDGTTEKDMSQPGVATTTAAGAPGASNVVEDERRTSTSAPGHERSLGERIIGYVSGYGPAEPQYLPLTDPKTLLPLNLKIHEAVSKDAESRKIANENRHTGLMKQIMNAVTGYHGASEYGPADPKDLSLTDPRTLKLMSAASLASAAPMAGTTKTAAVTDTGVKDKEMAPFGVPTSSNETNVPTSKVTTTESHSSGLKSAAAATGTTVAAAGAAAGAAAAAVGAIAAGAAANLRRGSHDGTTEKDMSQPGVATTTAAGAPGISNVVEDERRTSTSAPDHERSLGERIIGYVSGYGPAEPQYLPLTDPKTLLPLNLKIHEAVSKDAESRKIANENRHTGLMKQIMNAVTGYHGASEYGPADPKDLSLTDPRTLKLMSAASLASAAPMAGTTKTAAVADTGVKDKGMAPAGVPMSSDQMNVPTSKAATTESHPRDLKTAVATAAAATAAGTAAAIGMNKQPTSSTRATNPMATTATQPMATTTTTTMVPPVSTTGAQPMTTTTTYPTTKTTAQPAPAVATQPLAAATTYPTTKTMAQPVQTTAAQPMTAATTYPTAETTTQPVDTMTGSYPSALKTAAAATGAGAAATGAAPAMGKNRHSMPSTTTTYPTTTTAAQPVSTTATQPVASTGTHPLNTTGTHPSGLKSAVATTGTTVAAAGAAAGAATVATGAIAAGAVANLRRKSHDGTTEKDMSQPGVATTTAAGAPGASNVVEDERRTSTSAPGHERSLGERIMGFVSGNGPADPQNLPLTDPKTLLPLNLDIHEAVSKEADSRRTANENRHAGLMQRIMNAVTGYHSASEYGPADPKDLSLTDPRTLKLMSAASLASAAPMAGTTKTAGVMDTGVKDKGMAPAGVPMSSDQTNVPTSKAATTESYPSGLKTAAATGAAATTAGTAAAMGKNRHSMPSTTTAYPVASTGTHPLTAGPAMDNNAPIGVAGSNRGLTQHRGPSASEILPAGRIATAVPPTYKGPLPQVEPGEEIVWMKTITTTEYYDDNGGDTERTGVMGEPTMNNNINNSANYQQPAHGGSRRHSSGGLLDRLMGRRHSSGDKGKQRM